MSGQEQQEQKPEPFVWERYTGRNESNGMEWDDIAISEDRMGQMLSRFISVPVARLVEFEAFVRAIREEVEGMTKDEERCPECGSRVTLVDMPTVTGDWLVDVAGFTDHERGTWELLHQQGIAAPARWIASSPQWGGDLQDVLNIERVCLEKLLNVLRDTGESL